MNNIPEIEYFIVENVNVKEPVVSGGSGGSKTRLLNIGKHDAGTDITIDRFEIRNSDIVLPSTVLMMSDASEGMTTINHIRIDNCLVTGINDTRRDIEFIESGVRYRNIIPDVGTFIDGMYESELFRHIFSVIDSWLIPEIALRSIYVKVALSLNRK